MRLFLSRNIHQQTGFTLLEAIVALVLVSGAGMALFGWINSNIMALSRIQEVNARSEATTNVLEYMDRVNPLLMPEGNASLGAYSIRWHTQATSNLTDGTSYPRGISLYQLALYNTKVTVRTSENQAWFELQLQQVGYKKVRSTPPQD